MAALSLLLAIACSSTLHAQEGFEVHGIDLIGNTTLSDSQLRSRMSTKSTSRFQRTILGKESFLFSSEILQSDLLRIKRLYQREGFLDVLVEPGKHDIRRENRSVKLQIVIAEGVPITTRTVRFSLSDNSSDSTELISRVIKDLLPHLELQPTLRFRDSSLHRDQVRIIRLLEDQGFPYATAEPILTVDRQLHVVDMNWLIDTGPRCQFGSVTVSGLKYAHESLIVNPLTFETGNQYSREALEESQRRIYGLSMFHVATVKARLTSEQDSIIPVNILIDEAPRLTSKIGVGYGREEKFRVYSDSHLLGVFGGARQLNLYMKHSDIEPYHLRLRFRQHAFVTSYTTLEVSPFVLRQREPAFDQIRYGSQATILHQLTSQLFASATYLFEKVDLDTTSVSDVVVSTSELDDLYQKSSILLGMIFDNSAPMFSPERGYYAAGTFGISGLGFGSEFHYTRLLLDIRGYQKLLGVVLAGRIKAGAVKSTDTPAFVPLEDRFYAGGSSSVRGWGRAELGPIDSEGTPIGGNTLFESSLELRYPIYKALSGAVFSDFGNVWSDSYSIHLNDLKYAAGVGLRLGTPIGPIRFDIAWPIDEFETKTQYHISVGEAF